MTIPGRVNVSREAIVVLRLRGPLGHEADVPAVVDTGFGGPMTLPPAVIASLRLARRTSGGAKLADGSRRRFELYTVNVIWGGTWRVIDAAGIGTEALLGMRLLAGHRLMVDVVPGGAVEVTPLP